MHLTIDHIKEYLGLKDNRSAMDWLKSNGLNTNVVGGKRVVNKWLFELKTNELLARDLKDLYPKNWLEIFKTKSGDEKIISCIQVLMDDMPNAPKYKRQKKGLSQYIK